VLLENTLKPEPAGQTRSAAVIDAVLRATIQLLLKVGNMPRTIWI
jgi:hypothetical protein